MRLGEKVLKLLDESGKKQNEFAAFIGASPKTVNGWKEGNRNPTSNLIVPICRFFEITPNDLFEYGNTLNGLDEREENLIAHYRSLDLDGKATVEAAAVNEHKRVKLEGDSEKAAN